MKDLVTGATGFVGSHLVDELLRRGRTVRCTVRRTSDRSHLERAGVETVEADLRHGPLPGAALEGIDRIFHVAGVVFGTEEEFRRGNWEATRNVVASINGPLRRLVHVSSLAVCGPCPGPEPFTESVTPRPISVYGRTKYRGEQEARAAGDRVAVTVIRPPVVYGPRDRGLLGFFQAASLGIRPLMPGERRFSIIHAADLARGIVEAAEAKRAAGRVYFLANEAAPSFNEMTARILEAAGRRRGITLRMTPRLMHEAATLAEWAQRLMRRTLPFSRDKVRELRQAYWLCSAAAARRDFGWAPRIGLDEGMRRSMAWYRSAGWV